MTRLILIILALAGWSCVISPSSNSGTEARHIPLVPSGASDSVRTDWGPIFDAYHGTGTIVLLDTETGTRHVFNPSRAAQRYSPASTFKVYNSLVALETGAVPTVDTMYTWDGIERGNAWDQDHSLSMGVRNSTVWLFQDIADRIGKDRYEETFALEPYGNSLIGPSVRTFWLGEPLAISANEQIALLNRLRIGDLAFRPDVQSHVREIMMLEEEPEYTLYGKTGWTWTEDDRSDEIGWIVGWIDRGDASWVFALNVEPDGPEFNMRSARRRILNDVLGAMGLWLPSDQE